MVAAALAAALAVGGCDGTGEPDATDGPTLHRAEDQPTVHDGLLVTRSTGEVFELHDAVVGCRPSQEDESVEVVRLTAPKDVTDLRWSRGRVREPFFYVEAEPGVSGWYELPLTAGESAEGTTSEVTVFGVDAQDQNELNASLQGATGSITVLEATCDPEPALAFTVSATLASEIGLPPVTLVGGFEVAGSS
ncbi:hypothetical protein GCM10009606_13320 [Nocardioides aquiterrae]|uniref:Lipoprotein n=1 Tax=Nocardioides aquiterrae TaxID=203799 RepID=A0ABN1UBK3_9ACTN